MIILPEMIGSVVGVYNGKTFSQVEIKVRRSAHYICSLSSAFHPWSDLFSNLSLYSEPQNLWQADMVGHYLAEFSMSYKPVKHGTAGIGATKSSRFVPLK